MSATPTVGLYLRVSRELHAGLTGAVAETGRSMADIVREAVADWLFELERKDVGAGGPQPTGRDGAGRVSRPKPVEAPSDSTGAVSREPADPAPTIPPRPDRSKIAEAQRRMR